MTKKYDKFCCAVKKEPKKIFEDNVVYDMPFAHYVSMIKTGKPFGMSTRYPESFFK